MEEKDIDGENNKLIRNTFIIVVVLMACLLGISMFVRNSSHTIVNDVDDKKSLNTSVVFNDIKIIANDDIFSHDALQREDENSGLVKYLEANIKAGDTVVYVGNSVGIEMLLMTKLVGQSGRVYGYNPYEKYTSAIMQSAKENGFDARLKLDTYSIADSIFDGLLVYKNNFPILSGELRQATYKIPAGYSAMDVRVSSLDALLPNVQNVNWLKIDSRENIKVLNGAENLIKRSADVIIILDRFTDKEVDGIDNFMHKFELKSFIIQDDGTLIPSDIKTLNQNKVNTVVLKK